MKEVKCQNCGEIIEAGFMINPLVSKLCLSCHDELAYDGLDPKDL